MKLNAITIFAASLFFVTSTSNASEQKRIFNAESYRYEAITGESSCKSSCERETGVPIDSMISSGWRIVSSSQKEVIAEPYARHTHAQGYLLEGSCGCTCVGIQYIIEKIEEVPPADPKVETLNKELDLLKRENAVLKQQITWLEKESGELKTKLKKKNKSNRNE